MDYDPSALRDRLTSDFECLTRNATTAAQIGAAVERLTTDVQWIVHDLTSAWNRVHSTHQRVPDELLAACLAFIPLRDRIAASHASHAWRSAALAFPSVWSSIDLTSRCRNPAATFELAVSRAGHIPLDLDYLEVADNPDDRQSMIAVLQRQMHRVRRLSWRRDFSHVSAGWLQPPAGTQYPKFYRFLDAAPVLESLITNVPFRISLGFLAGKAGRLSTLRIPILDIPIVCSALSTVTELCADIPTLFSAPASISPIRPSLFELFPRLRSLSLGNMSALNIGGISTGPARPSSLARLRLSSLSEQCDLAVYYLTWRTDATADVELQFPGLPVRVSPATLVLFREAVEMTVFIRTAEQETAPGIALRDSLGRRCFLTFRPGYYSGDRYHAGFASLLGSVSLPCLRSLVIEDKTLPLILDYLPRDLRRLTIQFHRHAEPNSNLFGRRAHSGSNGAYCLDSLDHLGGEHFSALSSLNIEFKASRGEDRPSERDAQDLLEKVAALHVPLTGVNVHIDGFSMDLVNNVIARTRGLALSPTTVFRADVQKVQLGNIEIIT